MDMQMGHGLPGRGTVIDANVVGIGPKFGVQVLLGRPDKRHQVNLFGLRKIE